ncbi:response regulator [Ruminococcus sp.]|uniref:response regulator n=1 Tax=Ruminococcus sp. TaxID=41978 RepID=UPI0025E6F1D2|nr:response regulator [Ruminococcus sp.]MBQ8965547.1 response regulator [Ruminococcus sp.]
MSKILIIDDDPMVARMVGFILKKKGHTSIGAENGSDGIAKLKAGGADLVLLDVEMPDENGIAVLERIRAEGDTAEAKVCLMTGTLDDEVYAAADRLGAVGCLAKPVEAAALMEVLESADI